MGKITAANLEDLTRWYGQQATSQWARAARAAAQGDPFGAGSCQEQGDEAFRRCEELRRRGSRRGPG